MRNDNKGRDIFYGVVAIATLIVAIVGATLAYFSVTATSNEGAVNATAAIVSIEYNDGQQVTAQAQELIPSTPEVVKKVYESKIKDEKEGEEIIGNACTDSNSRQVCSAYRFTVGSDVERTITAVLNNEHNGFSYLSYAVYNLTKGEWLTLNSNPVDTNAMSHESLYACSNENEDTEDDCYTEDPKVYNSKNRAINSIFGYEFDENSIKTNKGMIIDEANPVQKYELVLFIKESGENQNIDQGQNYRGTIVVEVLDGGLNGTGNITGYVK